MSKSLKNIINKLMIISCKYIDINKNINKLFFINKKNEKNLNFFNFCLFYINLCQNHKKKLKIKFFNLC